MINLLPPKNKEELRQETSWKIVVILGINLLAIFVCFSLILYASNIFILGEISFQEIIYRQKEKEFETPKMQALEKNLIIFNETFSRLDYFYQRQFGAARALEEISETVPAGIYLTNLSVIPKAENGKIAECVLAGFSSSREILLKFKENLEEKENFEEIHFPAASWVKPADINFTANFKVNPDFPKIKNQ